MKWKDARVCSWMGCVRWANNAALEGDQQFMML